jgi:hypothetical protein
MENFDDITEGFEELARQGLAVKTQRVRDGRPVYVLRKFATPLEIAEQERAQQIERGEREH